MIPKTIHYCWFGRKSLPKSAVKCIDSWRKFLPGYEIREWNEDNFDVNVIPYSREAYAAGKYAFVSDYARFWILYRYGGLYFDTDVRVLKSFDDILSRGGFMGREAGSYLRNICNHSGDGLAVAPGLGLGAEPGHPIYKDILEAYEKLSFRRAGGELNLTTVVTYVSEILLKHGLNDDNLRPVDLEGIWIYPAEVFCPMDHTRGCKVFITPATVSIHLYDSSWNDRGPLGNAVRKLKRLLTRLLGDGTINRIRRLFR